MSRVLSGSSNNETSVLCQIYGGTGGNICTDGLGESQYIGLQMLLKCYNVIESNISRMEGDIAAVC